MAIKPREQVITEGIETWPYKEDKPCNDHLGDEDNHNP